MNTNNQSNTTRNPMTPFGIRKKIKEMLGLSKTPKTPPPPPRPKYPVTFVLPDGSDYQAEAKKGDSLVLTSGRGPYPISTGCSDGTCGTCCVEVLEGADMLTPADSHEEDTKKNNGVAEFLRLGCQTAVLGEGIKIRIVNVLGEDLVE
jgi:ferredoxin